MLSLHLFPLFPVHLHCCETQLNKVKEKVKRADGRSSSPTCHSGPMRRGSSTKGSKRRNSAVLRDVCWGKTRLMPPDSTVLLSPLAGTKIYFSVLYQPRLSPHYPSHHPLCSLASPSFRASCFAHISLPFCHLFPAYKSCLPSLCYSSHFGTSVPLHPPHPPPLCLRLSLLPARRAREGHLCVRDGGRGWCSYIQLLLWITGRGWMDDKSRSRKDWSAREMEFPAPFLCMLMKRECAAIRTLMWNLALVCSLMQLLLFISRPSRRSPL